MVNKRYTANNRQGLLIILMLPQGGQMSIEFKGGYGIRNEAFYFTNQEEVQLALENDPRFGKSYRLSEVDGMDISEYLARKVIREREQEEKDLLKSKVLELVPPVDPGADDNQTEDEEGEGKQPEIPTAPPVVPVVPPVSSETSTIPEITGSDSLKHFKNAQAAKEWLNKEHHVPASQLTNKGKIVEKAKELGFTIEFETENK